MSETKHDMRLRYCAIRAALPDRAAKSAMIAERLFASEAYKSASEIFTYASFGAEADTRDIISRALADGKVVAVPYARGGVMRFYRIYNLSELRVSKIGVPEPVPRPERLVTCGPGTLLLVPGITMGKNMHRIGYGGGYYDGYLSLAENKPFLSVGVCFAAQVAEEVAAEAWDAALDAVLTEEGWV